MNQDEPILPRIRGIEIDALDMICRWQDEYKNSPSITDLSREIRRTREGTRNILYRLQHKGYIDLIRKNRRMLIVPLYRK